MRTAIEVARQVQANNPNLRLAISKNGSCVGAWSEDAGRYVAVIQSAINDMWVRMPYEIAINGKLPEYDWQPLETNQVDCYA